MSRSKRHWHPRRGVSWIEALIAVAMIATLLGLVIPAVQKVREASARTQCQNNLKRIGEAIHQYHATRGTLPPGSVQTGRRGSACGTNWAIEILPWVGQSWLYNTYVQTQANHSKANRRANQSRVPVHECPSDPNVGKQEIPADGPAFYPFAHGSYRAVSGRSWAAGRGFWDSFEPEYWPPHEPFRWAWRGALHATAAPFNGFPFQNAIALPGNDIPSVAALGSAETFAAVTDGAAVSLLVGEYSNTDAAARATFWSYSHASFNQSSISVESRVLGNNYGACARFAGAGGEVPCQRGFGSMHAQGTNFVMCDGSVRLVSYGIDINLLAAMATIAGSEPLNGN